MDSFDASKSELIHYWTDLGTESIEFTLAQARLYRNFPKFTIAFSPSRLKKGNVMAQSIVFRQFKDYFPPGTIHICNTSFISAQSRRFIVCLYLDQLFLGPDNGLFHLGFDDPDKLYYRINNDHFDKDPLSEIYIPAIQEMIKHPQKSLEELFEPKTVMLKPFIIQPVINDMNIRITCLYIDHQGSAYFNITKDEFERIRNGRNVRFRMSTGNIYGIRNQAEDVDEGEIVAFFDWGNILKLTQNSGNFSKHLAIYENSQIMVEFSEPKSI